MKNFSLHCHFGDECETRLSTFFKGRVYDVKTSDLSDEQLLRLSVRLSVLADLFRDEYRNRLSISSSNLDGLPF